MSNEDENEDRLTKNEFSELIQHLSMQEILSIEYNVGNDWAKLFSRKNVAFTCNLCVVEASSFKNLLDHINGRRHKLEMENVKELYHPDYTYPKSDRKESVVGKSPKTNEGSSYSVATLTESGCNNRQEKLEKCVNKGKTYLKTQDVQNKNNNIRNRNIIVIKPTSSNSLKSSDSGNEKGIIKEQRKFNEHSIIEKENDKEQQNTNENSIKRKKIQEEVEKNHNNSDLEKNFNEEQQNVGNISTLESVSLLSNDEKENNFNIVANIEVSTEEDGDCENKSDKSCQENFEDENSEGSTNSKGVNSKTKIVINPVAALALKKSSLNLKERKLSEENKPKYQTDKIIIPTANKNKVHDEKNSLSNTSQSHSSDSPKFSVKSYSSKSDDADVHGILGVEYVIKILKHKNDSCPRYECGLCELVLDGYAMQRHLEGYNHRLKFCEKHFPTAIRHYRQYMQSVPEHELFKVMTPVLEKLAKAIENHHGRNLPYECYEREFNLNRHEILAKAFSCRHASEQYGPTFTHVVGANEIDTYINGRHNYAPPTGSRFAIFDNKPGGSVLRTESMRNQDVRNTDKNSVVRDRNRHADRGVTNYLMKGKDNLHKSYMSTGLFDDLRQSNSEIVRKPVDDKTYNLMVDNFLKGTLKGIPSNNKVFEYRKRSASPSNELHSKKRKSLSPLRDNDIWQAYRHMVDQELNNLNEKFEQYRNNPEAHPSYNEEWQKFWKRRKDELISAGLDHRNYNYQPEWVKFIKVRIEELYNEEVESIKIKCRERLCLPMTNSYLHDVKYHVQVATTLNESHNAAEVRPMDSSAKNLPVVTSLKVNVPQVVSVLRLMTALEDNLGSLGPKITELLSKALQAEKSNPTLVNAIILTNENCSLIETAKEKFKGLVITGLFEGSKARVLQQVINDAEDLLKYAHQNREFLSFQMSSDATHRTQNCTTSTQRPLTENSVQFLEKSQSSMSLAEALLPITDKKEFAAKLASKLAASLVAQGKTDFDSQQLQQLMAVYSLIEKKKRDSGSFSFSKEATNQKKLSDTLADILKSKSTQSTTNVITHSLSNFNTAQLKNVPYSNSLNPTSITSFDSVLQNSGDNYLNNSTNPQFPETSYGINTTRGNQFEHHRAYSSNYANIRIPYQHNSVMNNTYNNDLYQNNNRIAQNWRFNSNMEMNSNYDVGRPNSYNQPTNWRNF